MFSVVMPSIAVTADQDLISIASGATHPITVHSAKFTQSSDAGDALAKMESIQIKVDPAVGSSGTTQTPAGLKAGGGAIQATARKNDTTPGTGGTVVDEEDFNTQIGYFYKPTPEERIEIDGLSRVTFYLTVDPGDSITMSGTVICEEIG